MPTNTLKTVPNKTEIPVVVSEQSAAVPQAAQDSIGKPEAESSDTHEEGRWSLLHFSIFFFLLKFE